MIRKSQMGEEFGRSISGKGPEVGMSFTCWRNIEVAGVNWKTGGKA